MSSKRFTRVFLVFLLVGMLGFTSCKSSDEAKKKITEIHISSGNSTVSTYSEGYSYSTQFGVMSSTEGKGVDILKVTLGFIIDGTRVGEVHYHGQDAMEMSQMYVRAGSSAKSKFLVVKDASQTRVFKQVEIKVLYIDGDEDEENKKEFTTTRTVDIT